VDSQAGITPLAPELARLLGTGQKKTLVIGRGTKVDVHSRESLRENFIRLACRCFRLGRNTARNDDGGCGVAQNEIGRRRTRGKGAPERAAEAGDFGRPNVGKSTLLE